MGLLSQMWQSRMASPENPSTSLSNPDEWLVDLWGGGKTEAGVTVNPQRALGITAFCAGVRILAESVASLPLVPFARMADGGRRRATEHPLYTLVHDAPNPLMTSFVWRETSQAHLVTRGNCYSIIDRSGSGAVSALWPVPPNALEPRLDDNDPTSLLYEVLIGPLQGKFLSPKDVLHIPGLGYDGVRGYDPITLARESLGITIATEKMAAGLYGRGARPSGVLSTDAHLSQDQRKAILESWKQRHSGADKSGETALVWGGLKWQQITLDPDNAQFLESRKFQVTEVARLLRLPPHMLGDLERATFSNVEQQAIELVKYSLRPWYVRWEQELNRKLLTPAERKRYFFEFVVDGLLRGEIQTRNEAMSKAVGGPWMTRNEARRLENLPAIEGGDEVLTPVNMTTNPAGGAPVQSSPSRER